MAHQPILRPYPSADPDDEPLFATQSGEPDVANLAQTLAAHGGGEGSADLALDLILNQIVEQARLATTATGAAIALMRDDELICRAAGGINAPELGMRLSTRAGMSGACLATGQVQKCEDTEIDLRADAIALRTLGIRSILVCPIFDGEELVGIFEIFAPRPNAFGERDVQTLDALSQRIVFHMGRIAISAAAQPALVTSKPTIVEVEEEVGTAPDEAPQAVPVPIVRSSRDVWTQVLNALVIALALLLGWIVGREGWHQATSVGRRQVTESMRGPAPAPAKAAAMAVAPTHASTQDRAPAKSATKPKVRPDAEPSTTGDLVVYEKGKVVYRWAPAKARTAVLPVDVGPETAAGLILRRVEPVYPNAAKQQGIEGPVELEAVIGKDGTVREVKPVSGDALLSAAAADAVRQWQFKPYAPEGSPVEFRTALKLNFSLP